MLPTNLSRQQYLQREGVNRDRVESDMSGARYYSNRVLRAMQGKRVYKKEKQVIELVIRGATNPQIAIALGTTEQMIKNVMSLLFHRYKVTTRVGLAVEIITKRHKEELRNANEKLAYCIRYHHIIDPDMPHVRSGPSIPGVV